MPRPYILRETRLVAEWVTMTFPTGHVVYRARLGAFDPTLQDAATTEAELRALGVWRRYADALIILPDAVHMVEGKIRGAPGALEQLDLYARLFPLTPEYAAQKGLPITRHLVWAINDPVVEALARERGILVHVYHPAWVDEYLAILAPKARSATLPGGLFPEGE